MSRHQVVVDTVVVKRALQESARNAGRKLPASNFLERRAKKGSLALVLDSSGALKTEYQDTCGREAADQMLIRVEGLGALLRRTPSTLPEHVADRLRQLGFTGTVDKLVLRTGFAGMLGSRIVCSDDSDYWDPSDRSKIGDHASACCVCIEAAGIELLSQAELVARCSE